MSSLFSYIPLSPQRILAQSSVSGEIMDRMHDLVTKGLEFEVYIPGSLLRALVSISMKKE